VGANLVNSPTFVAKVPVLSYPTPPAEANPSAQATDDGIVELSYSARWWGRVCHTGTSRGGSHSGLKGSRNDGQRLARRHPWATVGAAASSGNGWRGGRKRWVR